MEAFKGGIKITWNPTYQKKWSLKNILMTGVGLGYFAGTYGNLLRPIFKQVMETRKEKLTSQQLTKPQNFI